MRFLICTTDGNPCPPTATSSVALSDVMDFAALGVTPSEIFYCFGWGFAAVTLMFLLGYVVGVAYGLIRRI